MKRLLFYACFSMLLLTGCSLKKSTSCYDRTYRDYYSGEIIIVPTNQEVPDNFEMIGSGSYGEKGMTPARKCTYEAIIEQAMEDARKMGASLIYISNALPPNFSDTSCWNIAVSFYATKNPT